MRFTSVNSSSWRSCQVHSCLCSLGSVCLSGTSFLVVLSLPVVYKSLDQSCSLDFVALIALLPLLRYAEKQTSKSRFVDAVFVCFDPVTHFYHLTNALCISSLNSFIQLDFQLSQVILGFPANRWGTLFLMLLSLWRKSLAYRRFLLLFGGIRIRVHLKIKEIDN